MMSRTQLTEFIPQMTPNFGPEEADACYQYMLSGGYVTEFKRTRELEQMICDYTGAKHCFMVNNGTISLSLALLAVGVQPGDEVIVPNFTMIASANAIKLIGAIPILIDVEETSLTITPQLVARAISPKTKAVMHVSLNTRSIHLPKLRIFCDEHNLYLIEDSAQSLGSFYQYKHLGTFGHIGSFSFSSPKIISMGQGGALITDDDDLAQRIRRVKDFGRERSGSDVYLEFGINSKFTDLQAVVGIEQMKKLPWRVNRMREIWDLYYQELSQISSITMIPAPYQTWIPWFIDIYVDQPDKLSNYLKTCQVGSRRVYPPIHQQTIYRDQYPSSSLTTFPTTMSFSQRGLWLPSSTKLTDDQIRSICQCIREFYQN